MPFTLDILMPRLYRFTIYFIAFFAYNSLLFCLIITAWHIPVDIFAHTKTFQSRGANATVAYCRSYFFMAFMLLRERYWNWIYIFGALRETLKISSFPRKSATALLWQIHLRIIDTSATYKVLLISDIFPSSRTHSMAI